MPAVIDFTGSFFSRTFEPRDRALQPDADSTTNTNKKADSLHGRTLQRSNGAVPSQVLTNERPVAGNLETVVH